MKTLNYGKIVIFFQVLIVSYGTCLFQSCSNDNNDLSKPLFNGKNKTSGIVFTTNFESGSIGKVTKKNNDTILSYKLELRDDNNDVLLPQKYRTWFYVEANNVPINRPIQLEFSRLGFPNFFLPVYSYDGQNWQYIEENEAKLNSDKTSLIIQKKFNQEKVWIARTFPYTTKTLTDFIDSIKSNSNVEIKTLGNSPSENYPIKLIKITDNTILENKKTIWVHARTHAAEVGSSYLLEGLIKTILSNDDLGQSLRNKYVFKIVPMHNPDGVIVGNYRTNASSINLESQWYFNPQSNEIPRPLVSSAPVENQYLNAAMVEALADNNAPVSFALNLHSSNSDPEEPAFLFPHFGNSNDYNSEEQNLWNNQISFIRSLAIHYDGKIQKPAREGKRGFLRSWFPETWWWYNAKDQVTAITLETTYGKAGFDHWVTKDNWRELGVAVAKSFNDMNSSLGRSKRMINENVFKFPYIEHLEEDK